MRGLRLMVLASVAFGAATVSAPAQSVKHWSALPGREVRTIPLRGVAMGSEPWITVVPGRDGWIYLAGKSSLYHLLDANGNHAAVASFEWCDDRQARTIVQLRTPALACVAKHAIIEVTDGVQYRRTIPPYRQRLNRAEVRGDEEFVTWIDRSESGRWWYAYGITGDVGSTAPDGSVRRLKLPTSTVLRVALLGADLYVLGDDCMLIRVRDGRVREKERVCLSYISSIRRAGDAVWLISPSKERSRSYVRRIEPARPARSWTLPLLVRDVAYDGGAHTGYLLCTRPSSLRTVLVIIGPDEKPHLTELPMIGGTSIAVDARHRVWISFDNEHALAVIAPPGAWNDGA